MVKIVETSDQAVLDAIRVEARILPKLHSPFINEFVDYYEDLCRNKAYLVLEHAGN